MIVIADNVHVVEKRDQEFKQSGDHAYYVKLGNQGMGLLEVQCTYDTWMKLVLFDKVYDVEIDARTSGYKHYLEVVNYSEV